MFGRYFLKVLLGGASLLLLTILSPLIAFAGIHVVNPGESLYLISQQYGSSIEDIKLCNGLTGDLIYSGQQLYIPTSSNRRQSVQYIVRSGDTLFQIANSYGLNYKELILANGLKSDLIYPGETLVIPVAGAAVTGLKGSSQVSRGELIGQIPYARSDFDLLARLITAEADSESFLTKVAVGAVVLTRALSPLFPNTIAGVINQVDETGSYQFEPVLNGWINVAPSEEARQAAQAALNGVDPTNGALYFFESWVPNSFLQSRPVSLVSDSFTFSY